MSLRRRIPKNKDIFIGFLFISVSLTDSKLALLRCSSIFNIIIINGVEIKSIHFFAKAVKFQQHLEWWRTNKAQRIKLRKQTLQIGFVLYTLYDAFGYWKQNLNVS